MNTYPTTNWKARLAVGAVTITVAAGLLEVVTSGFLHPSADAVAARERVIAAQADQADRIRALESHEVKAAQVGTTTQN